jgi:hypothetical protein
MARRSDRAREYKRTNGWASEAIEWTDAPHCYAQTVAERFRGVPRHSLEKGFPIAAPEHGRY